MSMFELHDKINAKLYSAFNVMSDLLFATRLDIQKYTRKNARFRNHHKGERCFILGTGPSLNNLTTHQVSTLKNEVIFGVNSLYKAQVADTITPKYYTLIDNIYWGRSSHTFGEVYSKYSDNPPTFITDVRAKDFVEKSADSILLYAKNYPIKKARFDLTGNISITMNVVGFCILTAMYMGFDEVYLLGCDYNSFCSRAPTHCYDDGDEQKNPNPQNLSFYLKYYHLTTEFHYLIQRTARANGIKIINLTDGSLLDAYPSGKVTDILKVN